MGSIGMPRTALISIAVQGIFFGMFTILFAGSQVIILSAHRVTYNRGLWAACIVMYVFALTHMVIDGVRVTQAFIDKADTPDGTVLFLTTLASPSFVLKSSIYVAQTFLGDSCIIYRTYIVWNRSKWIVVVPGLLFLGNIVSGVVLLYSFATAPGASTIFILTPWGVSYLFTSLFTNIICTGLITFRIWRLSATRMTERIGDSLSPVISIVIESGAFYAASLIAVVSAFMSASWGHFIVLDSLSSIIGITFTMIIIRLNQVQQARTSTSTSSSLGRTRANSIPLANWQVKGSHSAHEPQMPRSQTLPLDKAPIQFDATRSVENLQLPLTGSEY